MVPLWDERGPVLVGEGPVYSVTHGFFGDHGERARGVNVEMEKQEIGVILNVDWRD